ncbi:MAG: AMP-binding protein [Anaerolineae bacterium]
MSAVQEKPKQGKIYHSPKQNEAKAIDSALDTLPKYFLVRAQQMGGQVAVRKKRFGIWQEYTWREAYQRVHDFSLGLMSLGLKRGEKVCVIGENDPEFYWAEIAVWSAGGITTAIFTDAGLQELTYVLDNADAVFLVAHDQEQVDKALAIRDKTPNVRKVIYWDDKGLWGYNDDWLLSFEDVEALGRKYASAHPGAFEAAIQQGNGDDVALFSYTSGTTSLPKGAMVRHRNLINNFLNTSILNPTFPTDNYLSFSPLAWITEHSLGVSGHLMVGVQVNFPESATTVQTDLREIAPSTLLFPSRVWENLASTIRVRINDSSWINRFLYRTFLPVAYRIIDMEDAKQTIPAQWSLLRRLAELAVFEPLRDKIGMTRIRSAFTSGAALSPDNLRFFRALGVELRSIYGSTEVIAATQHMEGHVKLASVGQPAPGVELKLTDEGEILIRSGSVFQGYYKDEKKTREVLDEEGFFHTGDAGYFDDDGHLIYLDRMSDMIELANGEKFSPQYIEGRLKFSPYIQDVMTVGGFDMHFVTAIINIDFENVARWAEKNRIAFTTFVDLSQKTEIGNLIKQDVERVNETLPPPARVQKFVILHKAFDADEAELTRTRKLRRRALEQKYGDMLNAMYENRSEVIVKAEVKYRDGRTGTIETAVKVVTV